MADVAAATMREGAGVARYQAGGYLVSRSLGPAPRRARDPLYAGDIALRSQHQADDFEVGQDRPFAVGDAE
jgi:hypothetical protein